MRRVRSSENVYEIEKEIWDLAGQLGQEVDAGNEERIYTVCKKIESRTAERTRRLRLEQ